MSKTYRFLIVVSLLAGLTGEAVAAFSLNGTRFIYDEGRNNISFEANNSGDKTFGGQVWIDNTTRDNGVYMIPQPSFFKVGAKQKQVIRIIKTGDLPDDRESLFWLNVQEIPPKPDMSGSTNMLSIAMNTKVKLIYRPRSVKNERLNAEKLLRLEQHDGETYLINPTPYYFAVVKVTQNGREIKLDHKTLDAVSQLMPFGEVSLGMHLSPPVTVNTINDWGGVDEYEIH
ncbi:TPA: fimbrial chaperone [Morganella morganii]|nr:fimbrial chaperone [Escherichia coli]HCR4019038.1 fimbrial chaperone [Morganella morganii]